MHLSSGEGEEIPKNDTSCTCESLHVGSYTRYHMLPSHTKSHTFYPFVIMVSV